MWCIPEWWRRDWCVPAASSDSHGDAWQPYLSRRNVAPTRRSMPRSPPNSRRSAAPISRMDGPCCQIGRRSIHFCWSGCGWPQNVWSFRSKAPGRAEQHRRHRKLTLQPELYACCPRALTERAAYVEHAARRFEQCGLQHLGGLRIPRCLAIDSHPAHAPGDQARSHAARCPECCGSTTYRHLASSADESLPDALRNYFRLIDRPCGARGPAHVADRVAEEWRVRRRREDGGHPDGTVFEFEFGLKRLAEIAQRCFRAGVGRHQRQTMEDNSRTDIEDGSGAARPHMV